LLQAKEIVNTANLAVYMISPSAEICDEKSINVYELLKEIPELHMEEER